MARQTDVNAWMGLYSDQQSALQSMVNCYNCTTGCGTAAVANFAQATTPNCKIKADMNDWTGLSNDQWCVLLSMLNSHNKNHEKLTGKVLEICWIINTGNLTI